jgi:hypothetical protein
MTLLERLMGQRAKDPSDCNVDKFVIPEGCQLTTYHGRLSAPAVGRARGGAIIVSQGLTSDDAEAEFEQLLLKVDEELRAQDIEVLTPMGPVTARDVLSSDIAVRRVPAFIVWILNPRSMLEGSAALRLLQALIHKLYVLATQRRCCQQITLPELQSPGALCLARVIREFGLDIRQPEADGTVLVAMQRRDGSVVSGFPGQLFQEPVDPNSRLVSLNRRKYLAQIGNDRALLHQLMAEEREALSARIEQIPGRTLVVERAVRLRRLLRSALESGPEAMKPVLEELIVRECGLLFFVAERGAVCREREPQSGATTVSVFPDELSARRLYTLKTGKDGPFALGSLPPREVFAWMDRIGAGLTLDVVVDEKSIRYVFLKPEWMRSLAEGKLPD